MFCIYFKLTFLPVTTETLSLYVQFLSRSFKSTHSIRNYISGVKTMHHFLGYSTEQINKFLINLSLKGIARTQPHMVKQAAPITPEILLKMYEQMNMKKSTNVVLWCLFLFAFFLFARKSNLVPTKLKDVKSSKFLLRQDVTFKGGNLLITIKWSKTIQFGDRILVTPLIKIPDSPLCPVTAYLKMCHAIKADPTDPLFTLSNGKPIFYEQYQLRLRQLISKIGLDSNLYSTHSFRRGGCTFAFQSKVPVDLIKAHGDWKSDCYQQYISFSLEDKLLVAGKMRENILSVV